MSHRYWFFPSLAQVPGGNPFENNAKRYYHHLIDSNGIPTHNYLVHKWTLNHLAKLASWAKWLNVFLRTKWGCVFESRCFNLNFRCLACFEQGVPWHPGDYRVQIHSETRTWHYKNIQPSFNAGKPLMKLKVLANL